MLVVGSGVDFEPPDLYKKEVKGQRYSFNRDKENRLRAKKETKYTHLVINEN